MGSHPTDVLVLNGVATIVHDLLEFKPVHELFQTHLKRWRKKNALILAQRRKAEAKLAKFWQDEPHARDPDRDEHWPARRIYSPDRTKSELFLIPPELNRKLKKYSDPFREELGGKSKEYNDPTRLHLLRSLDNKQDFSTTESFVLLAELHDAAYQSSPIGYAGDYILDVVEATKILNDGLSQVAVQNLATLVERVLDLIEAQADSKSKNNTGKTLQQIIQRSRKELARLVIRVDQHFGTHSDRKSVQDAIEASHSKLTAAIEAQGQRTANQIQIEAERQRQQQTTSAKAGGKTLTPPNKPAPKQGVSLRSAAEILEKRKGEGSASVAEILMTFRKHSHKFTPIGYATTRSDRRLYSVQTMAALIMKCGYADSETDASQDLKMKLEDCRDS